MIACQPASKHTENHRGELQRRPGASNKNHDTNQNRQANQIAIQIRQALGPKACGMLGFVLCCVCVFELYNHNYNLPGGVWPRHGPNTPRDLPRCPQNGPDMAQDSPKVDRNNPKVTPGYPHDVINLALCAHLTTYNIQHAPHISSPAERAVAIE